jgi:hypothetical protein
VRVAPSGAVLDKAPITLTNYGDIDGFDMAPAGAGNLRLAYDSFASGTGARRIRTKQFRIAGAIFPHCSAAPGQFGSSSAAAAFTMLLVLGALRRPGLRRIRRRLA